MLITTKQASEKIGVNQSRIRQIIRAGQLSAEKFGRDWLIKEDDLNIYLKNRPPMGRPKKKKNDKQ